MIDRQGSLDNITGGLGADTSRDFVNSQLPRQSGAGGVAGGILLAGVALGTAEVIGFNSILENPASLARSTDDAGTLAYGYGASLTYAGSGGGTAPGASGLIDDTGLISTAGKPSAEVVGEPL